MNKKNARLLYKQNTVHVWDSTNVHVIRLFTTAVLVMYPKVCVITVGDKMM